MFKVRYLDCYFRNERYRISHVVSASYFRTRLKGCEVEIAKILQKRWGHFVFDWYAAQNLDESANGSNMNSQWRRSNKNNVSNMMKSDL